MPEGTLDLARIAANLPVPVLFIIVIIVLWRKLTSLEERMDVREKDSRSELAGIIEKNQTYLKEHIALLSRISEKLDDINE